jgi:hypothetical protein
VVQNCIIFIKEPAFCAKFSNPIADIFSCQAVATDCGAQLSSLQKQLDDITSRDGAVDSGTLGVGAYDKLDILRNTCAHVAALCELIKDYHP